MWIEKLERTPPGSLATDGDRGVWEDTRGLLYFLAGDTKEARAAAEAVVARANRLAAGVKKPAERLRALEGAREARAMLAELLLAGDARPEAALQAWQAVSTRTAEITGNSVYVTVMRLPGGLTVFVQNGGRVQYRRLKIDVRREGELAFRLLQN